MDTKINLSLAICFTLFVIGLLSVGADLLSALAAALLFALILVAFFTGPAVLIASLLCFFRKKHHRLLNLLPGKNGWINPFFPAHH